MCIRDRSNNPADNSKHTKKKSGLADFGRSGLELALGTVVDGFSSKNNADSWFQISNPTLGSPVRDTLKFRKSDCFNSYVGLHPSREIVVHKGNNWE